MVDFMRRYLADFDSARKTAPTADDLVKTMKEKYPKLKSESFLALAAKAAF